MKASEFDNIKVIILFYKLPSTIAGAPNTLLILLVCPAFPDTYPLTLTRPRPKHSGIIYSAYNPSFGITSGSKILMVPTDYIKQARLISRM